MRSLMADLLAIKKSTKSRDEGGKKTDVSMSILGLASPVSEDWANGLPERLYYQIFSSLTGKDLISCRLVCTNWESMITPMVTSKCCLSYKGRPTTLGAWVVNKVTYPTRPVKRFLKVFESSPNLSTGWSELRMNNMTPKSSKILVTALSRQAVLNNSVSSINFNHVTTLHVTNSAYRFQRLHAIYSLMPKLETFTDDDTEYLLDWSICCKTFPEVQEAILKPFQGMQPPIKNLKVKRNDSGFKTLFLMKIIGFTCENLESFELIVDTNEFTYPMAFIDRMDYATVVGLMLNMNISTLKELRFQWVGHLTNHYYDELLRCIGAMSWNTNPWNLTKVEFHFDWIFLGNPDFHTIFVPFIKKLEHLEELKMRHIILQPEWAGILDQIRPDNYEVKRPNIEFRVMLTDNANLSTGQTPVSTIAQLPFLKSTIKGIRVAITSEHTDELRRIIPLEGDEFPGATELWIQKTEWRPHMRFMTYNVDKLCQTFRNLTTLIIADGDKYQYKRDLKSKKQWERMSNAHIWDDDMQLIFKYLKQLTVLKLRCRMVYLTDGGIVGISPGVVADMKEKNNLSEIPDPYVNVTGLSFSDLRDLTELCLHGLNKGISDITLYNGFKGMKNLKSVELMGIMTFSSQGKKAIKSALPDCTFAFN